MWFTSDNAGPVHPSVLAALARANDTYSSSYGGDAMTEAVVTRIREIFEAPEAAVYLVGTGTAANSLALACLCPPWGTVYCHRHSHIEQDECGAPEFFTSGAKLTLLDGDDAKFDAATLQPVLEGAAHVGVHNIQKGAVSITTVTENGAIYSLDEIKALGALAHAHDIPLHLDGARFTNALVALGCSPAEMTWKAGVDAVSFGGTKNGLMGVEAVILFDPKRAWEFELRRKRGAHLFSKHRYLAAQMLAYLEGDLWLEMARKANAQAARLSKGLTVGNLATLVHPVEANLVFAKWPRAGHRAVQAAGGHYYFWPFDQSLEGADDELLSARLVCNWATTDADVDGFIAAVRGG